ncbi:hypothetical protein BT93_E0877 [Corymbia citriodora subsp. variegata]|nr:hypothetical protein BT93_E0877 [Corymbia citriodora subsp. variegata]
MSQPDNKLEGVEDLERKKKKEEKAREKELKKLKAAEKAELAKLKAQQGADAPKKSAKQNIRRDTGEDYPGDYVDPETPFGEKKRLSCQMAKQYNPSAVEKSWYAWWEKSGFFVADASSPKPPFVIVLPPPNVTGALHIGHALTSAIQDTIIRWKRMSGYNALWVPGMDHAGIATQKPHGLWSTLWLVEPEDAHSILRWKILDAILQVVVEKKLMRERRLTRHDIGREKFVSEVWKWKDEYGGTILRQQRRLGASLDWSRECFTMDERRSRAVTEAFVWLFKEGLIYRDLRLVNWDCILRTAISDIEVDYVDIKERKLLKVPGYEDPEGLGEIVVATTRVETMLGDTAIAIHPDDKRYSHLHGKFAIHPFNGRRLPIICDAILVDPSFGTGAVKITPAHDPNDFEVGRRHNLEFINIFTDDGKINSNGGSEFVGMPRFKARQAITVALQEKGLYRSSKNNEMRLGLCSRTNDVVEPLIKPQWYVKCSGMAKQALDVAMDAENRKLEIIPKQYTADWKRWLENIRDWCISRQLWWGHQIPAWYVTLEDDELKELGAYNDNWIVAKDESEARVEASKKYAGRKFDLCRDPDVLDTWFSAGLFPLSILGWPDDTEDLKTFYPTSVLETGHDILFFWVARMVMMGIKLGGDVPFRKVYLHPMIRDAHGRKMSKSLGNVIDPLEVINGISLEGLHKRLEEGNLDPNELTVAKAGQVKDFPNGIAECGADALRFALVSYTAQSDRINLDIQRVVGYRQWCNKLWNAVRFAMSKLGDNFVPPVEVHPKTMPFSCKWILSVLNKAILKTMSSLESYEFSDAATAVYSWWQYQFCDVFIEAIKPYFAVEDPTFSSERKSSQEVLWLCLETGLQLLHPFMPFVTEELWQRLPSAKDECWTNERVELEMDLVESTVKSLRSLRSEGLTKHKNERLPAYAYCQSEEVADIIKSHELEIVTLAALSSLEVEHGCYFSSEYLIFFSCCSSARCAFENVNENLKVYLKVQGELNAEAEREKIKNKMEEIQKQQEKLKKTINASGYEQKVPVHIQEENATKLAKLIQEFEFFQKERSRLEAVDGCN